MTRQRKSKQHETTSLGFRLHERASLALTFLFRPQQNEMQTIPKVYLKHYDGVHMKRNWLSPIVRHRGIPHRFRLVPVDKNGNLVSIHEPFTRKSEYLELLKKVSMKNIPVAIQHVEKDNGKDSYLSCRTICHITGGALAEFRSTIGQYEIFQVEHCDETGAFSFQSHNGLYLHYNATLRTLAFKPEPSSVAKWMVHPLGLIASDAEEIIYVGVVNLSTDSNNGGQDAMTIMERTATGVLLDRQDHARVIDLLREVLFEGDSLRQGLSGGCSSCFKLPDTGHQWLVSVDDDLTAYIVITSSNFSQQFAVECVQDLAAIHDKYKDGHQDELLEQHKLNEKNVKEKEMEALMDHYDYEHASSAFGKASEEVEKLKQRMADILANMQENIESEEKMLECANELEEMTKEFKKRTGQLKRCERRKIVLLTAAGGGVIGGGIGFALGGPGVAALLASEMAEVGAGIGLGLCGGWLYAEVRLKFWERNFVGLGRRLYRQNDGSFKGAKMHNQ